MCRKFCLLMFFVAVLGVANGASGATLLQAPMGCIEVDGDLSDWDALYECPEGPNTQEYQMFVGGNIRAAISYAWDPDNLYVLVQETAPDNDPCETTYDTIQGVKTWEERPFFYDSIGIFRRWDVQGNDAGDPDAPMQDFWIGLTGMEEPPGTQRLMTRVHETESWQWLNSSVHGVAGGMRYVEVALPMELVLPDPPEVCTTFYASPLYCDGPWVDPTQEMIGGEIHPGFQDPADQTYVHLCIPEPMSIALLGLGFLFLRRRS